MKRKHLLFKEAVCKNRISLMKLFVNRSVIINELEFEDKKLTDPTKIAEGFNKFFAEIGPKLSENIEDIDSCLDEFVSDPLINKKGGPLIILNRGRS